MDISYEQLVESRDAQTQKVARTPLGNVYKKQIDKKFANVLILNTKLLDNPLFSRDLGYEAQAAANLGIEGKLAFSAISQNGQVKGLRLKTSAFTSFENLLTETPAVVAQNNFVDRTVSQILDLAEQLHSQDIYHVCFAPSNVMAMKGDNSVAVITNGSYYANIQDRQMMYGDFSDFVAPEVLEGGDIDQRSDIYSIGKFINYLFSQASIPLKYKTVIEKATAADPEKRYQNIDQMRSAIKTKGVLFKILFGLAAAIILALIGWTVYTDLVPKETEVEFVQRAPKSATDEPIEQGYDPLNDMGIVTGDSVTLTPEEQKARMEEQKMKEEEFRRAYSAKAAQIINKWYSNENMDESQQDYISHSQKSLDELSQLQIDLGGKSNLNDARSQKIAAEIIDELTKQKMNENK